MINQRFKLELEKYLKGMCLIDNSISSSTPLSKILLSILNENTIVNNSYRRTFRNSFDEEVCELDGFLEELFEKYNLKFEFAMEEPKSEVEMILKGFEISENALKNIVLELRENKEIKEILSQDIGETTNFFKKYDIEKFSKKYSLLIERYRKQIRLSSNKTYVPQELKEEIKSYFN